MHFASKQKKNKKKHTNNFPFTKRDKVYWIKRLVRTSSRNHYQIHVYLRLTGACMCLDLNNCRIIIVKIYSKTFYILYWTHEGKETEKNQANICRTSWVEWHCHSSNGQKRDNQSEMGRQRREEIKQANKHIKKKNIKKRRRRNTSNNKNTNVEC